MEQEGFQYWMLMMMKKKNNKVLHSRTCNEETSSWEERAFEKDHVDVMWPPRSYSCSFCKREFRSAQALGGHMNVHRRDRARLKQSLHLDPIRVSSTTHDHHHHGIKVVRLHGGDDDDDEGEIGTDLSVGLNYCKRPKLAPSSSLQFSLKPCLQASDVGIGFKASYGEELDLELRLGHDPQVK